MIRPLLAALLACSLAAACDQPFHPFEENVLGPFSMFGHLDLKADTQWIRVMPIRQDLLTQPGPIDAIVTLEKVGGGKVVTLRDSLFEYRDARVDSAEYVHNFWTTEPIEAGAQYLVRAHRSDGAETTALVDVPDPKISLLYVADFDRTFAFPSTIRVTAEYVLFGDVIRTTWDSLNHVPGPFTVIRERLRPTQTAGTQEIHLVSDSLRDIRYADKRRLELRLAVAKSDWPFTPGLSDAEITLPDNLPTTVSNGIGFVGGLARWVIPMQRCWAIEPGPDGQRDCTTVLDSRSASITGKVVRQPCSDPSKLAFIRLRQKFADGSAVMFEWKSGYDDRYRFEGIEPGSDLSLEFDDRNPAPAIHLPPLRAGERYVVPDVSLPIQCVPIR